MDFFSVLNQRQLDQNSELRRQYRISVCYAAGAVFALLLASVVAPAGIPSDSRKGNLWWNVAVLLFVSSSVAAYAAMLKALHALTANRFFLPSPYALPRSVGAVLLMPVPNEALTRGQRVVLVYGLLAASVVSLYLGLSSKPYSAYLLLLLVQLALFVSLWLIVSRMMCLSR
ncbi:hypothetical protein DQ04_02461010 [Trypanosoma grayi]|uniref:hypothetical protein n=1 Tax=Trypanosoma grayi TaxID=71804 RepID=UPI0004F40ACE|nr:hypothetical protein DQ04_02461010 [Trypanosoma grayi]KEG11586.1 hypothetical protein DQ04_02461010 [Trypanosoma grayi]